MSEEKGEGEVRGVREKTEKGGRKMSGLKEAMKDM